MPMYEVKITVTTEYYGTIKVEADNPEHATELAHDDIDWSDFEASGRALNWVIDNVTEIAEMKNAD